MRIAGIVLVASTAALSAPAWLGLLSAPGAWAQGGPAVMQFAEAKQKGKQKPKPTPKSVPKGPAATYAAMSLGDRVRLQYDLAWLGHFNGLINGEFNDRAIGAVRAFQRAQQMRESGVLAPPERATLASLSKEKQDQVGWRMLDDKITGAQIGVPTRQAPNATPSKSGMRWSSAQGQVQIETFRIREPGTALAEVIEQQKQQPSNRRVDFSVVRNEFFILGGLQGLKKFYVRAEIRDAEVRGMTVLYDQARAGIMDPVTVVMSSAFAPFPGTGIAEHVGPPPRRKVEYGTGIVVTPNGHILTDRNLTDGCIVVQVSGHGDAERVSEDEAAGVALLRVYGVDNLAPAALVHEGASGSDLALIGIADPQAQGGRRAASVTSAKLDRDALVPLPPLGFAGAAALDRQGRLSGMVMLKAPVLASAGALVVPPAGLASVQALRRFLEGQYITPATGPAGAEAMKASLVRVTCVRR